MRVVVRADAGSVPELGTGHIVRATKLAEGLCASPAFGGAEILFATRTSPPYELGASFASQAGYRVPGDLDLEPNTRSELASLLSLQPDVVIMDRLDTAAELVGGLRKAGVFVVTFDDMGDGRPHANLAIHPLLQAVAPAPNVFVGYDYLFPLADKVIRGEIRPLATNIFVSFGGFDHRHLTTYFLSLIPRIQGPRRYEIVVGDKDTHGFHALLDRVNAIGGASGVEIAVHRRPDNFFQLLTASDLAIVSGGLTAFGCAQAGVPAIGIPQYAHQLENLERLEMYGCLKRGTQEMDLDSEFLRGLVADLSMNRAARLAMSRAGMEAIDGKGLARTIDLIARQYLDFQR